MFPLTLKQQKTSRITSIINPEIQKIQAKYKGKKDNDSMQKMQMETQAIYDKYGVSPFGGCLPLLITFPILFALYRIIYAIPKYVPALKGYDWFLGLNIGNNPTFDITIIIPILAVVSQWACTRVMTAGLKDKDGKKIEQPGGASMKAMNYLMPLMSGFFSFSFPIGVSIYWIAGNMYRFVQSLFINRHLAKVDLNQLVEKNKDKAALKADKRAQASSKMSKYATTNTSSIKNVASKDKDVTAKPKDLNVNKDVKKGSISGYANMLSGSSKDSKKGSK
jgi:YidC/Oxa1 family membrane protein insertase